MCTVNTKIPVLDLRGKTINEVLVIVRREGIHDESADTGISDITHLYSDLGEKYESVKCVWLGSTTRVVPKVELILWNGKTVPRRTGCDLHAFMKKDGSIDWGQANTMNMMR
ncbi:MAG: hypothetical protein MRY49_01010 [Candidatus Pacebacteria bacterium]|nr:hypothetical protein [Candidatus Paceibacterota bacterium]